MWPSDMHGQSLTASRRLKNGRSPVNCRAVGRSTILTAMVSPGGRYRYEGRSDMGSAVMVSDGATEWICHVYQHLYTQKPVAGTVATPGRHDHAAGIHGSGREGLGYAASRNSEKIEIRHSSSRGNHRGPWSECSLLCRPRVFR